jgi:hypothetical protein
MHPQPIETCPSSDERILVFGRTWSQVDDKGKDDLNNWTEPRWWIASNVINGICYVDNGCAWGDPDECRVTHWMPLPPDPQ